MARKSLLLAIAFVMFSVPACARFTPAGSAAGCGTRAAAPATYRHVVVVMFENRTWSDVGGAGFGSGQMPYLHGLAAHCSYFTGWTETNTAQNSLTQYIGLTSGVDNPATVDDCSPSTRCRLPVMQQGQLPGAPSLRAAAHV